MDDKLAKQLLCMTGNEKFNAIGIFIKPLQHMFIMNQICPACSFEHKEEMRGYIDRDHQDWGYYIKCPTTGCKIYMRRK